MRLTTCHASLTFAEAQALLAAEAQPLGIESISLSKAGRRVLAEDVCARIDAPRVDVAAMDGFAVRGVDLAAGLRKFTVSGASYPGTPFPGQPGAASAVRIMTGAPMPDGLDRVLPIECVIENADEILLEGEAPVRSHVRARASDIRTGEILLRAGQSIDARTLIVAAAGDLPAVPVWIRPKVHVLTAGDELVEPGAAAQTTQCIPDSLAEALLLLVHQWGGRPTGATRVPDEIAKISIAAEAACQTSDVLVVAGGASRGDRDLSRTALASLGLELRFAGVAIKPGKPVWYGKVGKCHVIGLPGNPTAALTVARLFLVPLLAGLGGQGFAAGLRWRAAELAEPMGQGDAREQFLCGHWRDGLVHVIPRQGASAQMMLATANVLVRRAADAEGLPAGASVEILPL